MAKTYTAAGSATAGDVYTATAHNVIVTDVNNLIVPPMVQCTRSSDLSYTSGANITWNSETYDTDAMHDTSSNTDRITIQTAGVYIVSLTLYLTFTGTLTGTNLKIAIAGSAAFETDWYGSRATDMVINGSTTMSLNPADQLTASCIVIGATSPIVKTSLSSFSATWIGRTS
jgi:hypothetical protein